MLETRHSPIEFLGKDGFQWFIAQVAPDKSWRDKNNQNFNNGFRAKIRILGYHPADDTIPDDKLPWAHFLVSPQFGSGNQDTGTGFMVQGGEMCIGFFLDGDEGQQPVVIGTFFSNYNIGDNVIAFKKALSEGTTGLQALLNDPKIVKGDFLKPQGGGRIKATGTIATSNNTQKGTGNNDIETILHHYDQKSYSMKIPDPCEGAGDSAGGIAKSLQQFFKAVNRLDKFSGGYLDPVLNKMVNIDGIIGKAVSEISSGMSAIIRGARVELFDKINKGIDTVINHLNPNYLMLSLQAKGMKDGIFCAIENIMNGLKSLVGKFLKQLIGKLVSVPLCAAEQFLGGLMGALNSQISKLLSPLLSGLSLFTGIKMPSFGGILGKAMKMLSFGMALFACEGAKCDRTPDFLTNAGADPKKSIGLDNVISNFSSLASTKLPNAIDKLVGKTFPNAVIGDEVGSPAGGSPLDELVGGCDVRNQKCFPPRVEIFGGGGFGAIADAVVSEVGEVIGVRMIDEGEGYSEPPFVAIIDDCDNGRGAIGTAILDDDRIINIVINDGGSGYLAPDKISDSEGVDVIGEVIGAEVIITGVGYQEGDMIVSDSGQTLTPVIEDGRIVGAKGSIDQGLDKIPFLTIESETGIGAELSAITRFVKREVYTDPIVPEAKIITVISCPRIY